MDVITDINLSSLADKMIQKIQDSWKSPFSSPVVIFSDSKLEQWFRFYWMRQSNEVLLNLDMVRLNTFLFECVGYEGNVLNEGLLRDLLIAKLIKDDYCLCLDDSVRKYLTGNNESINHAHLFDFASQMATLLLDYEITKPEEFIYNSKGIKFGDGLNSKWQEKLYYDLIGKDGIKIGDTDYKTLFQAYKVKGSKVIVPEKYKGRDVFMFGFSGLGELHLEILKKIDGINMTLYLQTGNITNEPYKKWTRAGYDHYLKCTNVPLADRKYELEGKNKKYDGYFRCPSKLREIERLYSSICQLIQDGYATPQDILVVAPNIGEYRNAISQVFDANKGDGSKDVANPLRVPYVITDYTSSLSFVAEAVNSLVGMLYDKNLSRDRVFNLLRNPIVQYVRGISDDEVTTWLSWVEDMNVYRDRNNIKDWEYAKKRLLLSRLSTDMVTLEGVNYRSYSTIDTQNDGALYRFISVVDDLYEWCGLPDDIKKDDLSRLDELLASFIHRGGDLPKDLVNEGFVYAAVKGYINQLCKLFNNGIYDRIPLEIICLNLGSNANCTSLNVGMVFVDGVTFSSIVPNRVMPSKYLFMIGMDSKSFPHQGKDNELDYRVKKDVDHSLAERELDAFFCMINAAENVRISYVYRDLKNDDMFFPASPVQELFMNADAQVVSVDETRDWNELFTSREWRNKANYDLLLRNTKEVKKNSISSYSKNKDLPDKVSISQLRDYLVDPFVAYVNRLFGCDDDNEAEAEAASLEQHTVGVMMNAALCKEYVKRSLKGQNFDVKQELLDSHYFTDEHLADKWAGNVVDKCKKPIEYIKGLNLGSLEIDQNVSLELQCNDNTWRVTGDLGVFKLTENKLVVIELSSTNFLISAYIKALVIVAQKGTDGTLYEVELHSLQERVLVTSFVKAKAIDILQKIYNRMFVDKFHKCVLFKNVQNGSDYKNMDSFVDDLKNEYNGPWKYFCYKDMFNIYEDVGYSEEKFLEEYVYEVEEHRKLFLFIEKIAN